MSVILFFSIVLICGDLANSYIVLVFAYGLTAISSDIESSTSSSATAWFESGCGSGVVFFPGATAADVADIIKLDGVIRDSC